MDFSYLTSTFIVIFTAVTSIASTFSATVNTYTSETSPEVKSSKTETVSLTISPTTIPTSVPANNLFNEVNKFRDEQNISKLTEKSDLCEMARIRLNEQVSKGTLDGHVGFRNFSTNHSELSSIFQTYNLVAEFLAYGGKKPKDTVLMWYNSPDHRKLLTDDTYKFGCVVSLSSFAVAIAAY
jgi:uncharacterized protein YkwD